MSQLGQNSSDRVPFLPSQTFLAGITELLPTQLTTLCAVSLTNASLPQTWSRPNPQRESRSLRADSSLAGLRSCVPPSLPKQKRFPKEETVKFLEAERQACVSVSQRRPLLAGGCVHFQQAQT